MVDVDATLSVALVLATASFFGTTSLAASIVRSGRKLPTLDHLIHVSTTALDGSLLRAGWTLTQVALGGALMRMRRLATAQCLATDAFTRGHRIKATTPLLGCHRKLSTRTAGDL